MGLRGPGGDGQSCLWWSQGCSIGCDECATETYGTKPIPQGEAPEAGKIGFRTRYCNSTMEPTLPKHAWTLNVDAVDGATDDSYRYNPWRAPGFAPVTDPCGQAGGKYGYQHIGGDSVFYNTSMASMGMMGSKLPPTPMENRTRWVAGTWVEVAWGPRYNHGGGYQYRLCPASEPLTEECFQRHPLEFDRTKQTLKWNNGTLEYPMGDKAIWVDGDIVKPKGSTWARDPLPRIYDLKKKGLATNGTCPGANVRNASGQFGCLAFPAPCPWDTYITDGLTPCNQTLENGLLGRCDSNGMSQCSDDWTIGVISDHVLIPSDLAAGEYVLSWRWDCEETAQIWQNCADVIITAKSDPYVNV